MMICLRCLNELLDDDGLVRHLASDTISAKEIDRIEQIGLYVLPQLFERRTIKSCPAVSIVNVFLNENVTCGRNLLLELDNLALYRSFLLLCACSHARTTLLASYTLNRFHELLKESSRKWG